VANQVYATERMRAENSLADNPSAWGCMVRALSLMNTRDKLQVTAGRELMEKAIALTRATGTPSSRAARAAMRSNGSSGGVSKMS
jgi:hypothetical protein